MPLYEYFCESCGRTVEVVQSFSERPLSTCDRCGGRLKKLLSPPALQFKGSGWYVSDYGRSGGSRSTSGAEQAGGNGPKDAAGSSGTSTASPSKDSPGDTSSKKEA